MDGVVCFATGREAGYRGRRTRGLARGHRRQARARRPPSFGEGCVPITETHFSVPYLGHPAKGSKVLSTRVAAGLSTSS